MGSKKKSKRYCRLMSRTISLLIILFLYSSKGKCCNDSLLFKVVFSYINDNGNKIYFKDDKGEVYMPFCEEKHFSFEKRKEEELESYYDMRKISPFFLNNSYESKFELSIDKLFNVFSGKGKIEFSSTNSSKFIISPLYRKGNRAFISTAFFDDRKRINWNIIFMFEDEKINDVLVSILSSGPGDR